MVVRTSRTGLALLLAVVICASAKERPLVGALPKPADDAERALGECEQILFDRLAAHVAAAATPEARVSFGTGLDYAVAEVRDARLLYLVPRGASSAPPISWPWAEIAGDRKIEILSQLPLAAQERAQLARLCFSLGCEQEAHDHLHQAILEDPSLAEVADQILTAATGAAAGSRFEWFIDRFVEPQEKERILVATAEAWLLAKQAEEDERYERADSIFAKAAWLQTKGFFEMARGLYRKVAAMSPDSDLGQDAATKVADNTFLMLAPLRVTGPSQNRVDFVVLGDGYRLDDRHQDSYRRATEHLLQYLLEREVFAEYASYFNFWRVHTTSKEDGVDNATQDFSTALGGKWSAGSQGQVTVDHNLVRSMLDRNAVTWDNAMVMVKRGGLGTGGGGISAFAHASTGTVYHELGHSFAGLLDEYSAQVSDTPSLGGPPQGWNIASSDDPANCPWKHWLDARTQGVGLFRGGAGGTEAFRPTASGCVMNSGSEYCVVCREQVVRTIYRYVRPIERVDPVEGTLSVRESGEATFELEVMKPASRHLDVTWMLNDVPIKGGERREENGKVKERLILRFDALKVAPGYRGVLTAVVHDATSWVLRDETKLLESRVSWKLEHPDPAPNTTPTPPTSPAASPPKGGSR